MNRSILCLALSSMFVLTACQTTLDNIMVQLDTRLKTKQNFGDFSLHFSGS